MALANIAECLHKNGLSVIIIDWDLEAPGLETFFCLPNDEMRLNEFKAPLGLIDMIVEYKNAYPRFSAQQFQAPAEAGAVLDQPSHQAQAEQRAHELQLAAKTRKVLLDAKVPEFLLPDIGDTTTIVAPQTFEAFLDRLYRPTKPLTSPNAVGGQLADTPFGPYLQTIHSPDQDCKGLYLISAGARSGEKFGSYVEAVQSFGWSEFYAACGGHEYFAWFREKLKSLADVILIDSRTGVTEMGGVCTRHIPDAVVSFCAPNFQNVDGVARVVGALNKEAVRHAREDRYVTALFIPTQIDNSEVRPTRGVFKELC